MLLFVLFPHQVQEPHGLPPRPNEHDQPVGDNQEPADGEDGAQQCDGLASNAHPLLKSLVNMFEILAVI